MRKQISGSVLVAASVAGIAAAASGAQPGLAASAQTWRAQLATDPTGAVGLAAATLLWLLIGLVAVGVVATVLSRAPGAVGRFCDALSQRLLPAAVRRTLHLMIGVTVGVTALAPSGAWAASAMQVRPGITASAPADSLPNPLPSLGEPGGPVTIPTASAPPPQVAETPTGTPETPTPTEVATPTAGPSTPASGTPTPAAPAPDPTTSPPTAVTSAHPTTSQPPVPQAVSPPPAASRPTPTAPEATAPPARAPATPPRTAKASVWPGIDTTMAGAFAAGAGAAGAATTPATPAVPATPAEPAVPAAATAAVSVAPGDSLWVLAARQLARADGGAAPSDTAIAAEWPRWWAANRAAIGANPDLLIPGQHLTPPA